MNMDFLSLFARPASICLSLFVRRVTRGALKKRIFTYAKHRTGHCECLCATLSRPTRRRERKGRFQGRSGYSNVQVRHDNPTRTCHRTGSETEIGEQQTTRSSSR
jgi:hypothetical protein